MWFFQWNSKLVNKGRFAMTPFFLVQFEYSCVFLLFSALSRPWSSNWYLFLSLSAYQSLHFFIYFGLIQIDRDIFTANNTWVQSVSRQTGSLFIHVQPRFRATYDHPWPNYIEFESRLWDRMIVLMEIFKLLWWHLCMEPPPWLPHRVYG